MTADPPLMLSIAAVERDTGLSKDTLRVWERRYGFPDPQRQGAAERAYPLEQVEKLRVIKRLMDAGHRPGRIVSQPIEALQRLSVMTGAPPREAPAAIDLAAYVERVRAHDIDGLRRALARAQLQMGWSRFIVELLAPLHTRIGDAWMRGHLAVFEEHLYTEAVHVLLRQAIAAIPAGDGDERPRVLLTTFPHEPHGLGLLMAEALCRLEGCRCTSLGVQTPLWDTVLAATALRADVVALSFSSALTPTTIADGLAELREKLPRSIDIWAGGSAPVLARRAPDGVTVLATLDRIATETRRWHAARG